MIVTSKNRKTLSWILTLALLLGIVAPGSVMAAPGAQESGDPVDDWGSYWTEKVETSYGADDLSVPDPFSSAAGEGDTITAAAVDAGVVSDDFNRADLDTSRWTFVNPLDDGRVAMVGTGTADAALTLTVPAGVSHDPFQVNRSVRVMQDVTNGDFAVQVKFDSQPTLGYQIQGIIVEQDADNWLRFDIQSDGGTTRLFGAKTESGVTTPVGNPPIPASAANYLRLTASAIHGRLSSRRTEQTGWRSIGLASIIA